MCHCVPDHTSQILVYNDIHNMWPNCRRLDPGSSPRILCCCPLNNYLKIYFGDFFKSSLKFTMSVYKFSLPMVCIHSRVMFLCGNLTHHILAMFIFGYSTSAGLSYSSKTTAIPPWHVHVTKEPTTKSCLGGISKKSFTLSQYPT